MAEQLMLAYCPQCGERYEKSGIGRGFEEHDCPVGKEMDIEKPITSD